MATSKKFSQLPAASSVGNGDLFAIAHEDALAETGYVSQKLTAAQAGQKVNGDTEYPTGLPSFPTGSQNPFDALEKLNTDIEALYPVNTVSGSIANFTTSLVKPLVALSSTIVAQQAGSGTPSPSNPRSISGFSSVNFTQQDSESTTVDSFTIQLGQPIYAGNVDCICGSVTNTGVKLLLDGDISTSDLRLTAQTGFTQIEWYPYRAIGKGNEIFKCDKFEFNTEKGLYRVSNNNLITAPRMFFGLPDTVTTREEAVAWFASNPTEIVYELATPTEITGLTANNFMALAGENNIFTDCGEVTVGFKQNIQEYIDAQIAATQALIL